jgi:glycosyltransferase involved in cell wall biosynthesis
MNPSEQAKQVHIAWTVFQRRQESMRAIVGFDCWFMPVPKSGKLKKAFNYLRLLMASVVRLRAATPDIVWVQLPQVPALWAVLIYRAMTSKPVRIIADCHNAQLREPWSRFPFALWSLRRCDAILVHNDAMHEKAAELGWPMGKVLVLEDVPAVGKAQPPLGLAAALIKAPKPWMLFPGSFAADEPIQEVFEAARQTPELTFIITGRPERARQNGHNLTDLPPNVVLPGFLSLDVFDDLLREADVVMGLTKEEGIQLSVCNEALGFGKPLVTSNTRILGKLFGAAAVLVDTRDPTSIARGCTEAMSNTRLYSDKSLSLASARVDQWRSEKLVGLSRLLDKN